MGGAGPFLADEADHLIAVELHGEPGPDLPGDEDRRLGDRLEIVDAPVEQVENHPHGDAVEVREALLEPGAGARRPEVSHLEGLELEGFLRCEMVLADQIFDPRDELLVGEHEDLGVEDARFVGAGAIDGAGLELFDVLGDVADGGPQPAHLPGHLRARDDAMGHLRQV